MVEMVGRRARTAKRAGEHGLAEASAAFQADLALESRASAPVGMAAAEDEPPPGYLGHRARMRQRLLNHGPDALLDHELLEVVLFLALPRRDTKPIARALIGRFGSYANSISAPPLELLGVPGLGEAGVAALKTVQGAALRLARAEVIDKPVLNSWDRLIDYLTATLSREKVEHVHVLYLDTRNRLVADEAQARGTVNHTPVYPREVVKHALELHATALILVHNHPSGDSTPSPADCEMTREVRVRSGITASVWPFAPSHKLIGRVPG